MPANILRIKLNMGFLILVLTSLMVSCVAPVNITQELNTTFIVPIKGELPRFDESAKQWQPDANLVSVELPLGDPNTIPYRAMATYLSLSAHSALMITLENNKNITTMVFPSIYETEEPIGESNWKYDSADILLIVMKQPEVKPLISNGKICGKLMIKHDFNFPNHPALWHASIEDCRSLHQDVFLVIDPMSGKVINR